MQRPSLFSSIPEKEWTISSLVSAFTSTLHLRHLDATNALSHFSRFSEEGWSMEQIKAYLENIPRGDYLQRFYNVVEKGMAKTELADWLNNFIGCARANVELSLQYIDIVTKVLTAQLTNALKQGGFTIITDHKGELTLNHFSPMKEINDHCRGKNLHPLNIYDFPPHLNFSFKAGALIRSHAPCDKHRYCEERSDEAIACHY